MDRIAAFVIAGLLIVAQADADYHGHLSSKLSWGDICSFTSFKESCELSIANSKDKSALGMFKTAMNYTIDSISKIIKDTKIFQDGAKDESIQGSLRVCNIVLDNAVADLKRSIDLVGSEAHDETREIMEDLKNWLSAVLTNQETCIDAFQNTTGDTGLKMKHLLESTKDLTSNLLAITHSLGSILAALDPAKFGFSRRLLSEERGILLEAAKPSTTVALDGSGEFKSIQAAVDTVEKGNNQTFIIKIKAGVYKEHVYVYKGMNKVVFIGDGPNTTIITGDLNFANGVKTYMTSTLSVNAEDFMARDIGIENTAGPEGHQAVALRVSGDRALFHNVNIDGYQDTLYAHTYRQFYRQCRISGTIDFIFGDSLSIFQQCDFIVRKPMTNQACMVTAQGRLDERSQGAIIIQNGHFMGTPELTSADPKVDVYLGRPWKMYSRTIVMQSNIDAVYNPEGWAPWFGDFALDTLYYAEYENRGPGSNTTGRVKWKGIHYLNTVQAETFTAAKQFNGDDQWIKDSAIPYDTGFMKV